MSGYWTVDLRHFLDASGNITLLPGRGRRLAEYWAEIVSQATLFDDPTTIRCRRRPGRRPCGAVLTIYFSADLDEVLWFCPSCRDGGQIGGWRGTFWDNSDNPERASV